MKTCELIKSIKERAEWVNSLKGIGQKMISVRDAEEIILSNKVEIDTVTFGQWQPVDDEEGQFLGHTKCSCCGWRNEVLGVDTTYCPNCGAVMFCS